MITKEIRHAHVFCGIGGGAKGFNKGNARVGNLQAEFRCIGGIDCDEAAIRDFGAIAGVPGTVLDLFTRDQYIAFHGREPSPEWREATPADILRAFGNERPHIVFLSAPCKGFSGLLSESRSLSAKYQALNQLAVRGLMLVLEAYKDDPVEFFLFENVPRIATRGRPLLDQIEGMLGAYGYASAETTHDCGELGNLAQSRKRFLLVARHIEKVPPFLYEPVKRPLRAVGDVLGRMLLPGDLAAGPMHRVPRLHWKTWVRLAFVEAGSDWRSLQKLRVENGHLADYAIAHEADYHHGAYGVQPWNEHAGTVTGNGRPASGTFSVADPRFDAAAYQSSQYGVNGWDENAGTITGQRSPGQGVFAISDPRIDGHHKSVQMGVRGWDQPTGVIKGDMSAGCGPYTIADPRIDGVKHNNCFRIVRWDQVSNAVTGGTGPSAGGLNVADPRGPGAPHELHGKYHITPYSEASRAVISGRDNGGCYVADPRSSRNVFSGHGVTGWDESSGAVAGESFPSNGKFAVADPRFGDRCWRDGPYGVTSFGAPAAAVAANASHDNGFYSVADPRAQAVISEQQAPGCNLALPKPSDRLVCVIRSLDNTWHRPFTTLELAALQSLIDPEEKIELDGLSDSAWRERIGNMVPPDAAEAVGSVIGTTLLLAWTGETFMLNSQPIWVRDIVAAVVVAQRALS